MTTASLTGSFFVNTAIAIPSVACIGKQRFERRGDATAARDRQARGRKGRRLDVYECDDCGGFHIGGGISRRIRERFRRR